jgi:branched-chain amino acid transport system permease protein
VTPRGLLRWSLIALAVLVVLSLPDVLSRYWLSQLTLVAIYATGTMGLSILFGRAGQLSLAHASFFGLGAYIAALLSTRTSVPLPVEVAAVAAASVVAGVVVGLPALRTSGLRLAIVTLIFGLLFQWVLVEERDLTGGTQGTFAEPATLGWLTTANRAHGFYLAVLVGLVGGLVMVRLGRTSLGRAMLIVRDSELAARSVGVSLTKTKLIAFSVAAVYGGVAGLLFAHQTLSISPSAFDLFPSVYFLVAVILGGAGSVTGAWLGAAYIVLVPAGLDSIGSGTLYPIVGGALLVIMGVAAPQGLVGLARQAGDHARRAWRGLRRRGRVEQPA